MSTHLVTLSLTFFFHTPLSPIPIPSLLYPLLSICMLHSVLTSMISNLILFSLYSKITLFTFSIVSLTSSCSISALLFYILSIPLKCYHYNILVSPTLRWFIVLWVFKKHLIHIHRSVLHLENTPFFMVSLGSRYSADSIRLLRRGILSIALPLWYPCWSCSRVARCTLCTWEAPCPCPWKRTGTACCYCWRWWARSRSRRVLTIRTPSSWGQTCALWRSPATKKLP